MVAESKADLQTIKFSVGSRWMDYWILHIAWIYCENLLIYKTTNCTIASILQSLLIQHHCLLAAASAQYLLQTESPLTMKLCNLVAIYHQSDYCT